MTIDELQIEIQGSSQNASSGIDALTDSLVRLKNTVSSGLGLDRTAREVSNLRKSIPGARVSAGGSVGAAKVAASSASATISDAGPSIMSTKSISSLSRIKETIRGWSGGVSSALREVGTESSKSKGRFDKFLSSLGRIAMYRFVRFILKAITTAMREGIENLARYSAAMNELDASHANKTLSDFKTMSLQVKNALGTALMPMLNALYPLVRMIANGFIYAANAINQFLQAIAGAATFTRATEVAQDYAAGLDSATSAAKALKNATLGIDELNIIAPNAGGGAAAVDYSKMFTEADIDPKIQKIGAKVKEVIDYLKNNMELVKETAILIGSVLLGWKLSGALVAGLPALIGKLKEVAGAALLVYGAFKFVDGFLQAWKSDNTWGSLTKMILGTSLAAGGLFLLFGKSGFAFGLIAGGIGMLISGLKEILEGNYSIPAVTTAIIGFAAIVGGIYLKFGAAAALLATKIGLISAAILAVVALAGNMDEFVANLKRIFGGITDFISGVFTGDWNKAWNGVKEVFRGIWNGIIIVVESAVNSILKGVNWLIDKLNTLNFKIGDQTYGFNISNVNEVNIPRIKETPKINVVGRAVGGFPPTGELFMAREAGPELVGTIGGRTAVANQGQIVEAIREGVYDAVVSANSMNGGRGDSYKFEMEGREITTRITKRQTSMERMYGRA